MPLLRLNGQRPPQGASPATPPSSPSSPSPGRKNTGNVVLRCAVRFSARLRRQLRRRGLPDPLSPPYPALSKEVELRRAMTASARSGIYSLSGAEIVFEDQWLVVVNKPSGVYCEALLASLSSSIFSGSPDMKLELHLANRLDRDTSGLMVITKAHKVAAKLVKAFTDHQVKKTYVALCIGHAPEWNRIRIRSGHGRSKFGAWRVYSVGDVDRTLPGGSVAKQMDTAFQVLFVNKQGKFREPTGHEMDEAESIVVGSGTERNAGDVKDDGNEVLLIRAYPRSGRTHQIRLHCQYLGFPIRGDVKYGGVHEWKGEACDAHALHAESLSLEHPITGEPIRFQAPLPLWASEICET